LTEAVKKEEEEGGEEEEEEEEAVKGERGVAASCCFHKSPNALLTSFKLFSVCFSNRVNIFSIWLSKKNVEIE
jgi:hypothetical protein